MIKRFRSSLWVLFVLSSFYLSAQVTFTMVPQSPSVGLNQEVNVDVEVSGFANIVSSQFSMNFDPSILQFVSISSLNSTDFPDFNLSDFNNTGQNMGILTMGWFETALLGVTVPDGTVMFTITFNALTEGNSIVDFSNTPTTIEVIDTDLNTVAFTGESANINVLDNTVTLSVSGASIAQGENTCVSVSVNDFVDILGLQFSINYDPTLLEFESIQNINLSGLILESFGTPPNLTAGTLTLVWEAPGLSEVTVPDGTSIFDICFNGISAGDASVAISSNPTAVELINTSLSPVNTMLQSGMISVTCAEVNTTVNLLICPGESTPPNDTLTTQIGCDSIITYNSTTLSLPNAAAGADAQSCLDSFQLTAPTLADTLSGLWSSPSAGISFSGETLENAIANGLIAGENQLVWTVSHPNCPNYDQDTVLVNYLELPLADAGSDMDLCVAESQLDAFMENAPITGMWTSTSPALMFADPTDPFTQVTNLQGGFNVLTWTLSHPSCPNYSTDEVQLFYEDTIEAIDDEFEASFGNTLTANFISNDAFQEPSTLDIEIINEANDTVGTLNIFASGAFEFLIVDATDATFRAFTYRISSLICPELSSEAVVTITLQNEEEEEEEVDDIVFTPNGDGINDVLIIPELLENPGAFPNNSLAVINRWGDIVYFAEPYENNWDGRHYKTGKVLPAGSYFYVVRLDILKGLIIRQQLTLIR